MANDGCGCGCDENITALAGETGESGTSVAVETGSYSTSATSLEYLVTFNRLNTASNDIYNSGSGYTVAAITVPAGVAAANVAIFDLSAQINATDVHDVTVTILTGGVAVANISAVQNCGTRERLSWRFEIANVSPSAAYSLKFVSTGAAVAPVLTGANLKADIYC